jgi:methylenetetrahydrofolate--tRNA-(uracil-5-)-methyltransferase
MEVTVIGGGLAGSEASYQLASRGARVTLYEMRPKVGTEAHKTPYLSELVCSNSLKSRELSDAHGLLKEELRRLGSLLMEVADRTSIPGGKALVVDRDRFALEITHIIENHPNISVVREEVRKIPEGVVIVATGPLTSPSFSEEIRRMTGEENLYFFDAISPIVDGETIDMERAFFGVRYGEGDDYLNCPMTEEEYKRFYESLLRAEKVEFRDFERIPYFEGCLPIEVMAERGRDTLLFGPLKPVGLKDRQGRRPYAVVQLRREDSQGRMWNLVGFQTKLTYSEQERVFRLVPALRNAKFLRYGSIHRNTYINSPKVLNERLQLRREERIFFAGQITGVEGYVESTSTGLLAGLSALSYLRGKEFHPPPRGTAIGSLIAYITEERRDFQPMNVNFGLIDGYRRAKKAEVVERALHLIEEWKAYVES